MTVDEARECFDNDVKPAVFSADIGDELGVRIYPLAAQRAHLWAIWHGFDWDNPSLSIKEGAVVSGALKEIAAVAIQKLFAYREANSR